jgi:hypothetical protein
MPSEERRVDRVLVGLTVLLVAGAGIVAAAAGDFGLFKTGDSIERKPLGGCADYRFDPDSWDKTNNPNREDTSDPGDPSPAQLQARQLVACDSLIGLRHEEVLRMLGEPGYPRRNLVKRRWFSYSVGLAPDTYMLETESLSVRFGDGGRVDRASISA